MKKLLYLFSKIEGYMGANRKKNLEGHDFGGNMPIISCQGLIFTFFGIYMKGMRMAKNHMRAKICTIIYT